MIDISPLYQPINHRYKGVYRGRGQDQWDAIVQTPTGKLERKGRFNSQEGAARAVATYYREVYGHDWPEALKDRLRRVWRIKKVIRYPFLEDLHRGPSVTVYTAEVALKGRNYHKVIPQDIVQRVEACGVWDSSTTVLAKMWDDKLEGWRSLSAALVAIRMYRYSKKLEETTLEAPS